MHDTATETLAASNAGADQLRIFFRFVRAELTEDLEQLVPILEAIFESVDDAHAQMAGRMAQRLRMFADLAHTLGGEAERRQRVPLGTLLAEQLERLEPYAAARSVRFEVEDTDTGTGPVYGDGQWLAKAVHGYLALQLMSVPRGACILLQLRQSGGFKMISSRWRVPVAALIEPEAPTPGPQALPVDLARTVIQAHGGRARLLRQNDNAPGADGLSGFVIGLPTGAAAPVDAHLCRRTDCLIRQQSERYAADLARILADAHSVIRGDEE